MYWLQMVSLGVILQLFLADANPDLSKVMLELGVGYYPTVTLYWYLCFQ